jgi:hypothetical protein
MHGELESIAAKRGQTVSAFERQAESLFREDGFPASKKCGTDRGQVGDRNGNHVARALREICARTKTPVAP